METDGMKGEAMGRSDLASGVPVALGKNGWHRVGSEATETDVNERTDDAAHHLMAERRGRNFKAQQR